MPIDEELLDYESVLRKHAGKSMLWASLLGAMGLGLISLGSANIDWVSGLVYLPLLLVMLISLMALLTNTDSDNNLFRYLADAYAFCAIFGATLLVIRADMIDFLIKTSPIQYAALISFPLCFHRRSIGIIRNIILMLSSVIGLSIYDVNLAGSLYLHYIFGFFAGSIVHFISEDRMYKDFLYKSTIERERMDSSRRMRHLHSELRSRCLPHQIELIYNGYHYRETMPVYRANFWVSCLSLVPIPPTKPSTSEQRQTLSHISQKLKEKYQLDFIAGRLKTSTLANPSNVAAQSSGFYIRCDDTNFFVSYDYPFALNLEPNKGTSIVRSMLHQLMMFRDIVASENVLQLVQPVVSLAYDSGAGIFTGSLSNYEIEGRVFTLADRYQKSRFQIKTINEKIKDGYLTIIFSSAAYEKINKDLPRSVKESFVQYRAVPHVRDDQNGKSVYAWFIDYAELDHFYQLVRFRPRRLQLVA